MPRETLTAFVEGTATRCAVPGVAVGVLNNNEKHFACHGVTSIDNPVPVDRDTLFVLGSLTKTFTAMAVMRLVADGRVHLSDPVRRFVPELKLTDDQAAERITVLNLLNHTSGLDFGLILDTGEGDDALAAYVSKLATLKLITSPGARTSYSQAGYNLAGRIVEKVMGRTFERAVSDLILEPLGLSHSFFARDDVMTRRFAVGHNRGEDGTLSIARLWRRSRGDNPGGGLASSIADQLRWARFQLGDGRSDGGERLLPVEILQSMREPTAPMRGSNLGHAIGIGWFLRDIGGVRTAGHGGSANGQFAELLLVPERNFAVIALSNCAPEGITFNQTVVRWALNNYLGITDRDPDPLPYDEQRSAELVGTYQNEVMTLTIDKAPSGLRLEVLLKPEIRSAAKKELPPDHAPFDFGLLSDQTDEYVITSGAFKGQRGYFTRDESGAVTGVDLAGRLFTRVPDASRH
jgi:CubicO group peptidase (beta-lactamase class C family)